MLKPTKANPGADYSEVTEVPGLRTTREAVSMLYTRYAVAAQFCEGKRVLKVGCGAGLGLGHLAQRARSVVGGDYTESVLRYAQRSYPGQVPLVQLDAKRLPFANASFDVVILFEAIYYLDQPQFFLQECRRVLGDAGFLLLSSVNKEWSGFNPSPLSRRYFSASELRKLLAENGFEVEIFGGFRASPDTASRKAIEVVRRLAIRLHLIPRTMRGKEFLKRLFYGRLVTVPTKVQVGMARLEPLVPLLDAQTVQCYMVLYALARVRTGVSSWSEATRSVSTLA